MVQDSEQLQYTADKTLSRTVRAAVQDSEQATVMCS